MRSRLFAQQRSLGIAFTLLFAGIAFAFSVFFFKFANLFLERGQQRERQHLRFNYDCGYGCGYGYGWHGDAPGPTS